MAKEYTKFLLSEDQMPTSWYNVLPDLPVPLPPPLHPGTHQPIGPDDLAPIMPMALIMQEMSPERWIEIPDEVQEIYKLWRPSPLYRARRLEKALDTPAHIYYKWEGVSPVGSHKPNTAIAQCYYAKKEGVTRLTTETGAGQWGSALSMAAAFFDLKLTIYMVKVSYHQKPYRRIMMQAYGAEVIPSPSDRTHAGRTILEQNPNHLGSLGLAISEGVEDAATHDDSKYSLGSALNHVLMHQTVIGLEAKAQMEMAGEYPDVVIACCGGGSNYGGFALPFISDKLAGARPNLRSVAVEPSACPSLTRGKYVYDFADTAATAPLLKMHTLGHTFMPPGIHAGGLRYHGDSPIICLLYDQKVIEAAAYPQVPVFDAALQFAKTEGFLPAPESGHALKHAIVEALEAKEAGESRVIVFNMSGHGLFDMGAYEEYLSDRLQDYEYPQEAIEAAMAAIPQV